MKTKGDGMERRAKVWVDNEPHLDILFDEKGCVESLARLLRKVAREAEKRGREAGHKDVAACAARRKRELSA